MFHPSRACSWRPFQAFSLIWNRYHSAMPCFTRRTRIVVAFIPSTSMGSSAANRGIPASASWRSSLSALNVSRPDRSMSSQITAAKLGLGEAASASRSARPPSRGYPHVEPLVRGAVAALLDVQAARFDVPEPGGDERPGRGFLLHRPHLPPQRRHRVLD